MAEGGEFAMDQPELDHDIDDDHDDDDEQNPNETRPFLPGTASTPYHGGEEIEMQTNSTSGLPETSYDEIPLVGGFIHEDDKPARLEKVRDFTKSKFPRVDFGKLGSIGFSKKSGNKTAIVSFC